MDAGTHDVCIIQISRGLDSQVLTASLKYLQAGEPRPRRGCTEGLRSGSGISGKQGGEQFVLRRREGVRDGHSLPGKALL